MTLPYPLIEIILFSNKEIISIYISFIKNGMSISIKAKIYSRLILDFRSQFITSNVSRINESITYYNTRLLYSLEKHIYYKLSFKKVNHKIGKIHREKHYF